MVNPQHQNKRSRSLMTSGNQIRACSEGVHEREKVCSRVVAIFVEFTVHARGIFRKTASPTLSTMTPIVLDKHELHSTWPVYSQPDSRHVVEDRLTLTVDRTHTCYGPGDRIAVNATFRNDAITVIDLRAFEFVLKETVIFRAGPHSQNKKGGPQVKVTAIGEQKVPMNRDRLWWTAPSRRTFLRCSSISQYDDR